jgi:hypothetical protein
MGIVRAPSWRAYGAADKSAARSYRAADVSAARRSVIPSPLLFIDLIQYLYIYAAPSTCSTASGYLFDTIRQGGPTRTSADVSVPRLAGFSLIT